MDLSLIVVLGYEGQSVMVPQPKVTSVDTRPSALPSAEASVSTLKTAGTFALLPNQGRWCHKQPRKTLDFKSTYK